MLDAHNSLDSVLGVPVMCLLGWILVCKIADYITCLKYVSIFLQLVRRYVPLYNIIFHMFCWCLSSFIHTCFLKLSFLSFLLFEIILPYSKRPRPFFRFQYCQFFCNFFSHCIPHLQIRLRHAYNVHSSRSEGFLMVISLINIHFLLSLYRTHSNMEFFLQLDYQLQGMYHSGCGSVHEAPNSSYCFLCKSQWSKLVSQIVVDCSVVNICHMIVSLPDCCILLFFCVFDATFWSKLLSFQTMSSTFIRKRDSFFYKSCMS